MDIDEALLSYMEGRTSFYLMLAKLYKQPISQEELDVMDAQEFCLLSEQLEEGLMNRGFNDMYRFLRRRNTGTRQILCADYTRVFLGTATYEGFSAQPYASLFLGSGGQLMGPERMAVSRIYHENAVQLSQGIDLPEDHLAFECEFLAIMNQRATDAVAAGDSHRAIDQLELQRKFVEGHVLSWLSRFYALSRKLVQTRFYRGVLKVTKGYFEEEPQAISEIVQDLRSGLCGK